MKPSERFNLALNVACTAIAILFSSNAADRVAQGSVAAQPSSRRKLSPFTLEERRALRNGGALYEVKVSVAAQFGIRIRSVSDVITGKTKNAAVLAALRDRIASAHPVLASKSPFSSTERDAFLMGGRYRGLQQKVARELNLSVSTVSAVVAGRTKSARVLSSLRTHMALADRAPRDGAQ